MKRTQKFQPRPPIDFLLREKSFSRNITGTYQERPEDAVLCDFPADLDQRIIQALKKQKIKKLYSHQKFAYDAICSGNNTIISTGVASGKSLCYQLPILQDFLRNPDHRGIFLYPTKALAQDQKVKLLEFLMHMNCNDKPETALKAGIEVYDGDVSSQKRRSIRENAIFVLSNPDMLHVGILPHHTQWAKFFAHLKYVVVDEVHIYRGIFGSHFANVIRRFKRIADFYGAKPVYIAASATLSNSLSFVEQLFEAPFRLIDEDGSPKGTRHFVMYNPPVIHQKLGIRKPVLEESLCILKKLAYRDSQILIFAHTRKAVEMMVTRLREEIDTSQHIFGYRSGYLPEERREIEQRLRNGDIHMVIGTNALEMGIDIGGIDMVMIVGYPGSITSVRQQSGRAGRKGKPAYAIMLASDNLIDQYLVHHPEYLIANNPETALINPDNPYMLFHHLQCAVFEKPFSDQESFGKLPRENVDELLKLLEKTDKLHRSGQRYFWRSSSYPANAISLRTATADQFILQVEGDVIGMVDRESALWMVHPEAIYLHNGEPYKVTNLDLRKKKAVLQPAVLNYFTFPQSETTVEPMKVFYREEIRGGCKVFGQIKVENQVIGYKKIKWDTGEMISKHELDMPVSELVTYGCWITFWQEVIEQLKSQQLWNNESNRYGSQWRKIADKVRRRDRYACKSCGKKESDKAFDVHHIIPFKSFNRINEANRMSNLITLCSVCHRAAERQVYIQSSLAGLSYLLRHIAPLYTMSSANDIRVLSDAKSSLAGENPAVIFYDSVPGGIGLSENLFFNHEALLEKSLEIMGNCGCAEGCPACVGPIAENGAGAKKQVEAILKLMVKKRES